MQEQQSGQRLLPCYQGSVNMVVPWLRLVPPCLQGTRAALWMSLVSILAKLGTLQMEQLRNQALVILQRFVSLPPPAHFSKYIASCADSKVGERPSCAFPHDVT